MTFRSIFIGADDRLRAPWRIIVYLLIAAVFAVVLNLALLPWLRGLDRLVAENGTAESITLVLALLAAHWCMLVAVDRRGWDSVGLGRQDARVARLAQGWTLGALPILLPSLALLLVGWFGFRASRAGSSLLVALQLSAFLLPAALLEELFSRGYLFATLREWLGWPVALGVTSVGFGMLHLANPGANAQSVAMVTLAGIFLGAIVIVTGSLYAAWMAHWAWNWTMAVALHASVSGVLMPRPDYQMVETGPDLITGGRWGPEGGLAAATGMIVALGYLYMKRRAVLSVAAPATSTNNADDER